MTLRPLGALVLSLVVLAPPALAVESGKAEGTVTINRKPVKLKYAFAKKEKDYEQKDRWIVTLTDRAVSRAMLADGSRLGKAVENGEVVAVVFQFDEKKQLENVEVKSKALQHKGIPITTSKVNLTGFSIGKDAIEGGAATTEDSEFFSDVAVFDTKFRAALGAEGKFGDNALAAKELAASAPKIADGAAAGTLKIDGQTIKLTNAIARTKPNAFHEKDKDVVVLLTNKPVAAEQFIDSSKLFAAVDKDGLLGILLTIDKDEQPYHMQFLHPKAPLQLSGSGFWNFDATDYSDTHVTGKFYTTSEQDFMDEHKYSYNVSFAVPVQAIADPKEFTVDASNGTKLPANGGDPGKAYMTFDKAARTGNLNEMKKFATKDNPMPDVSPAEAKQMLELMKLMRPAKVKVTGGFTSGDHATLLVEGEDSTSKAKVTGTIEMGREDGAWKLLAEKWKQ